ncbi:hypothetical protein CALCODRAFT_113400 [Calocera cornea HHB12733]|uniref:Uncharacterized protein n=1 Tax=Calocera cornea HHB12733 TaxID=1353952 RepID=A0A165D0Z8_9BASI|nr:hypothetical protein CALCODRAFT_113400 [Calocera cornea HHB12733]
MSSVSYRVPHMIHQHRLLRELDTFEHTIWDTPTDARDVALAVRWRPGNFSADVSM